MEKNLKVTVYQQTQVEAISPIEKVLILAATVAAGQQTVKRHKKSNKNI